MAALFEFIEVILNDFLGAILRSTCRFGLSHCRLCWHRWCFWLRSAQKRAARAELRPEIRSIGIQYLTFNQEYQRSPSNLRSWNICRFENRLAKKEQDKTFRLIHDGKFQLIWNAKIELKDQGKFLILGHETNASQDGGWVLSCFGEVQQNVGERVRCDT